MQKLTLKEKLARHEARRIRGYIHTARRMVVEEDYRRGFTSAELAPYFQQYEQDLEPFVRAEIAKKTPAIFIPRNAAKAYLKECFD